MCNNVFMNINPNAKVVLCYGDSNTYGTKPDDFSRYPIDVRWTGRLQDLLGNDYYIIEEGLGGRSTDLEHPNPDKPNRNGLTYFRPCLGSHSPLDIVIIMLGTNDLKIRYDRNGQDIADALGKYIELIKKLSSNKDAKQPKVVLVSPAYMDGEAPGFIEELKTGESMYDNTSVEKSKHLAEPIKDLADKTGCEFLDAGLMLKPGVDGAHLDEESHGILAKALFELIKNI